jgi:hypothetical protein
MAHEHDLQLPGFLIETQIKEKMVGSAELRLSPKGTALQGTGENRKISVLVENGARSPVPFRVRILGEMGAFWIDLSFARNRGCFYRLYGGGRGIRTPVTLSGKAVFKTACFNRSHIPPREQQCS